MSQILSTNFDILLHISCEFQQINGYLENCLFQMLK